LRRSSQTRSARRSNATRSTARSARSRTAWAPAVASIAPRAAVRDLADLAVDLVAFDRLADRVWELRRNLAAYDASYVATAERLGTRLVTLDARLASASGIGCEVLVAPRDAP